MQRHARLAFAVFAALLFFVLPRAAHADPPGAHTVPVAVLAFDSEDAEEQADAITGAMRSRIRNAPGWSLVETTASLGMLTAALKCPTRPPPECQLKIAEQVKADRYIWGIVTKGPVVGQVTVEVHLYQKSKPDAVLRESYADNLKDPNDDKGLGKIAARIVDRLGGNAIGTIVVRAGDATGEVIVDGEKHAPLQNGSARIDLAAGGHSVEVSSTGVPATKRNVLVTAGKETVVDVTLTPLPLGTGPEREKPFPTRKVVGGGLVGVGVILGAVAVVEWVHWGTVRDDGNDRAKLVTAGQNPCDPGGDIKFCDLDKDAKTASGLAIGLGAAGVVAIVAGAYLYLTGSTEQSAAAKPKPMVIPVVGQNNGGLVVSGAF